jgi:hypothetical protein
LIVGTAAVQYGTPYYRVDENSHTFIEFFSNGSCREIVLSGAEPSWTGWASSGAEGRFETDGKLVRGYIVMPDLPNYQYAGHRATFEGQGGPAAELTLRWRHVTGSRAVTSYRSWSARMTEPFPPSVPDTDSSDSPQLIAMLETAGPANGDDVVAQATAAIETADKWAQVYAGACEEVLAATTACLQPANRANGARNKIREHQNDGLPGTPIAIRNFTRMADEAEQEFLPQYRVFAEACARAQAAAADFIAAAGSQQIAEASRPTCIDDETHDRVATVKAILRSSHGPSPEAFIASVEETNLLIQSGFDDGNIYTPPASAQTDERTCPWCAETIKAAAVICRFCGRDLQVQPNAG